jgi:hypothetical protein
MRFPAAATPTENAVFGLVMAPSSAAEAVMAAMRAVLTLAVPCGQARPPGQPEARPAPDIRWESTDHLVPEDGRLLACGACGLGLLPGSGQRDLVPAVGWM